MNRHHICVIALSAAMILGLPAKAGTFVVVQSGPDAWTVLDPAGVQRDAATQRLTTWSVTVQRNLTHSAPPQPGYIRTLNEYDCAEHSLRWRSFLAYSRFGAVLMEKTNAFPDWARAPETGEGSASLRVLCEGGAGGAVVSAQSMAQLVLALMQSWDPPGGPGPQAAPPVAAEPAKPPPSRSKPPARRKTRS